MVFVECVVGSSVALESLTLYNTILAAGEFLVLLNAWLVRVWL